MTDRLALRDVRVRRGRRMALDAITLGMRAGEVLAVVGPNGAGKSTLVQTMALLERPASGTVLYDGEPVAGRELSYRRRMAVVFQEPLLLAGSVVENVALGLRLRGVGRAERTRRAHASLDRLGMGALAGRPAHALSGGEAQRASLARALALDPEVLLLDEPFAGLDPPSRARLLGDLAEVLHQRTFTTVFVTHDRDEALHLADQAAVLIGGRLRQHGPVDHVFGRPSDPEVAAFVGVETVVPGHVVAQDGDLATIAVGDAELSATTDARAGERVYVCIRPEDVALAPSPAGDSPSSARNRPIGRVTAVLPSGGQRRVELDCGFPLVALVTRRSADELGIVPGAAFTATFKATAVHVITARGERERTEL